MQLAVVFINVIILTLIGMKGTVCVYIVYHSVLNFVCCNDFNVFLSM